jgi:hypothetical protein
MSNVQRKGDTAKRAMAGRTRRRRPPNNDRDEVVKRLGLGAAGPDPREGLRLLSVFLEIGDPALRMRLIRQAEEMVSNRGRPR